MGLESLLVSLSPLSSLTEPSREWNLSIGKTHSEGILILAFNAFNCSAKRLASHLAEFLSSTVGRSLEFGAVKKIGKKTWN